MLQSTSMSILDGKLAISKGFELSAEVENCIFASSLTGATIQDGGMRERSNVGSVNTQPRSKLGLNRLNF